MKTYTELKNNIEKTIAKINELDARIEAASEKAFRDGGYDMSLLDFEAIDDKFKFDGVLKRQIQGIYKRYFTEKGWTREELEGWNRHLHKEDIGMLWVAEYRDTFKYVF